MLFLNQTPPLNKVPTIDEKRIEEHNQNFPWRQGANKFFEVNSNINPSGNYSRRC